MAVILRDGKYLITFSLMLLVAPLAAMLLHPPLWRWSGSWDMHAESFRYGEVGPMVSRLLRRPFSLTVEGSLPPYVVSVACQQLRVVHRAVRTLFPRSFGTLTPRPSILHAHATGTVRVVGNIRSTYREDR